LLVGFGGLEGILEVAFEVDFIEPDLLGSWVLESGVFVEPGGSFNRITKKYFLKIL